MTTRPSTPPPASDREALSALFDGELVGDAARFALKRLDHDQDWRATCERWQSVGDVLRNRNAPLPATFPYRVRAAVHAHAHQAGDGWDIPATGTARNTRKGGFRWGSVALAASAAVVAFFLARSPIVGSDAPSAPAQVVTASMPLPAPSQPAPGKQAPDSPGADLESATAAVAIVAIARPAQRNRNLQRDRAATDRMVSAVVASQAAVTGEAGPPPVTQTVADEIAFEDRGDNAATAAPSPFSSEPATDVRPWPRAVLPQYGSGALSAGLTERDSAATPSFYPFVPARPQETQAPGDARSAPDGATTNPQSPPPPSP